MSGRSKTGGGRGSSRKPGGQSGRKSGGKAAGKPGGRATARAGGGKSSGRGTAARAGARGAAPTGKPGGRIKPGHKTRSGAKARSGNKAHPSPAPRKSGGRAAAQQGGAQFIDSVVDADAVPEGPPEFAFVGRSNVGKSSLLNALSKHGSLARTSKTPGRTQRVNLFDVPLRGGMVLRFADLPGYGHAKVPGAIRKSFGPMIEGYLLQRRSILAVCVLVDARRDPDDDAINFVLWLQENEIRVELVVTKLDKVPKTQHFNVLERLRKAHMMRRRPWATSTLSGDGVDELREHMRRLAVAAR
ncbi:MAG: ribosome biogenesis GTP-binding protein YsxC [Myxococcales bacterium]|nr:ribosome biogenesis GTP-binding protein YsxC [Myxococcales bacterium]